MPVLRRNRNNRSRSIERRWTCLHTQRRGVFRVWPTSHTKGGIYLVFESIACQLRNRSEDVSVQEVEFWFDYDPRSRGAHDWNLQRCICSP
jgi:hypothetical protein